MYYGTFCATLWRITGKFSVLQWGETDNTMKNMAVSLAILNKATPLLLRNIKTAISCNFCKHLIGKLWWLVML